MLFGRYRASIRISRTYDNFRRGNPRSIAGPTDETGQDLVKWTMVRITLANRVTISIIETTIQEGHDPCEESSYDCSTM